LNVTISARILLKRVGMTRSATLFSAFFLAACGATVQPLDASGDALTVAGTIGPQSFTHGTVTAGKTQVAYAFNAAAGDVIAVDIWPTANSALTPTFVLLGPKGASGHRTVVATGAPRGEASRHLAVDGFKVPRTGNYLAVVGVDAAGGRTGKFSLRLWMQSSHLPRQEGSQIDLAQKPSAVAAAAVEAHGQSPHAWTDGEVGDVIADMLQQTDARVAVSSAEDLIGALSTTDATDAQRSRAAAGAAQIVGTLESFESLDPQAQSFALWWLGTGEHPLFTDAPGAAAPQNIADTVAQLVAAWPGAKEDVAARRVTARMLNGVVYGWQVEWSATQSDADGMPVWIDLSREWFDAQGNWLGEQSAGASEPDDD
jgi:hypothetical protein